MPHQFLLLTIKTRSPPGIVSTGLSHLILRPFKGFGGSHYMTVDQVQGGIAAKRQDNKKVTK